ncbi:Ig-like domain-containing protein [Gayadomonas joobiniege]|uniref:Ig-like domain-containing protein n=1 Tax=Gayadomonas joobiniege TaxID=1234606 RepID=UPI00036BB7DE|nr:Ig-like domain-containing protein [Gayadomonas joobiniege]
MKNLFLNVTALAVTTALTACGGSNEISKPIDDTKIPAVTVEDAVMSLEFGETEGVKRISLLQGVDNPYPQNSVFATKFQHVFEKDDDGIKLDTEPDLPPGAITKQAEEIIIDTSAWLDVLEYQESLTYEFSYTLDNGSAELVERTVMVKINGEEVVAEQIDLLVAEDAEVPVGTQVNIEAVVSPANTTFPELTWSTSDASIATINEQGVVTGVATGSVDISATSKDGDVTATTSLNVVTDSDKPIGVEVQQDGQTIDMLTVEQGQAIQLSANVLFQNKTEDSDDSVTWTGYNDEYFTVSENGLVEGLQVLFNGLLDVRTNVQGFSDKVSVRVTPSKNLLYNHNYNFENDSIAPWITYWENAEGSIAQVSEEAAFSGEKGLHLKSDAGKNLGITLGVDHAPQVLGSNDGNTYRFSFKIKVNDGTPVNGWFRAVAQGYWATRWDSWWGYEPEKADANGWQTIVIEKPVKNWAGQTVNGRFDFYLNANAKQDVYIDDLRLEVVENAD